MSDSVLALPCVSKREHGKSTNTHYRHRRRHIRTGHRLSAATNSACRRSEPPRGGPALGGNIATERGDGFQYEIGPNGFLDNNPATLNLCRELGLGEQLVPASETASRNRYLFLDGRLRRLPTGLGAFLRSDLLSWRGKFRLLSEPWQPRRRDGTDESIADFARRRAGREAAEVFADALVTGIHAGDASLLSIRATFSRMVTFEEEHGSVVRGLLRSARQRRAEAKARGEAPQRPGRMWTRPGLGLLVETLHSRLPNSLCGVRIQRIERAASQDDRPKWLVWGDGQQQWTADAVVLTCPAHQQAAVLSELDAELADKIGGIAYNRVAVVVLGYPQVDVPVSLDGFGFIAPQRTRRAVLGVEWGLSIFPDRARRRSLAACPVRRLESAGGRRLGRCPAARSGARRAAPGDENHRSTHSSAHYSLGPGDSAVSRWPS